MRFKRTFFLIWLLFWGTALGQTALDSTTLNEAVDATEVRITVTSASAAAVGEIAVVDKEAMLITAVDTDNNVISVQRGFAGSVADDHANSRLIYINPASRYIQADLAGSCTAGSEFPNFTPLINLHNGNRYICTNSRWVLQYWQEFAFHDSEARDYVLTFDGNAQDFSLGIDDSVDDFVLATGTALGTDNIVAFPNVGTTTSGQRVIFYGEDPATAADNDESYISFHTEDDAAAQVEVGRLTWVALDVSAADDDSEIQFDAFVNNNFMQVMSVGSLSATATEVALTLGDGGAEDTQIVWDGNATDFALGLDDSADDIVLADESALGTDPLVAFPEVGTGTSVQRAILYGSNPATPADNDETYLSFMKEDDSNTQVEVGRLSWQYLDVSAADDDSQFTVDAFVNNALVEVFFAGSESGTGDHPQAGINSADLGSDVAGPELVIGYNSNATPNSGTLSFIDDGGTQHYMWLDDSASPGDFRVHTAAPGGATADTDGTVVGTQTSPRAIKNILHVWSDADASEALRQVLETPVYDFTFKSGKYDNHVFTGIAIPDGELPWYGYDPANESDSVQGIPVPEGTAKALNEINVAGYMILAVRALNAKIEAQQLVITQLEAENARLAAIHKVAQKDEE